MPKGTEKSGQVQQPDLPWSLARLRWCLAVQELSSAARVLSELWGPWFRRIPKSKSQPCSCQGTLLITWPLSGWSHRQGGFCWHTLGQKWPQRPSCGSYPQQTWSRAHFCAWVLLSAWVLLRIAPGYRGGWVRADNNATGLRGKAKTRSAK